MMVILGEKLRCISDKLHWFEVNNIYEVVAINGSGSDMKISFKNCEIEIHSCQLDSFERIPAVQKYTFDDLIDVAVQAVKDGLIACDDFKRHSISFCVAWDEDDGYELASHHDAKYFNEAIEFIKSLYKETFVIECEEDIKRIKCYSTITLANGNTIKVKELCKYGVEYSRLSIVYRDENYHLTTHTILELKGATVE